MKLAKASVIAATFSICAATAAQAQDIKVGAGLIFSGWGATYGEDARKGIDLAIDELNEHGGVLNRKIVVRYDDSGGDRAKAVPLYRGYAADPDVVGMLNISSVEFVALDPIGPEVKLPLISIGSASARAQFSPWSFRVQLIIDKAMPYVLSQLKDKKNISTVAVIYDSQNNYSVSEMETVKSAAPTAGLSVTGIESLRTGEQDFSLQLSRLAAAKPSALYVAATSNEAALIISQARAMNMNAQIIGGAGLNDPLIMALPGNAASGAITFFPFDATSPQPAIRNFVDRYYQKYGDHAPAAYSALGYDAMMLLADAVRRAGTTDRDAIRKALGSTAGLQLADGQYRYSGSGDNQDQSPKLFEY